MGCAAAKPEKQERSLSKQNSPCSHPKEATPSISLMQETDKIESDYIFHSLDPLVTRRNYIKKAVSKSNNASRIVKVYNCLNLTTTEKQELERIVNHLLQIKHLNLVSQQQYYYNDNKLFLVSDFCDGGNLLSRLDHFSQLQQHNMFDVFCQIMAGVQFLHNKGIAHGNIQLESIVFTDKSMQNVKLIDYGISSSLKSTCLQWRPNGGIQEISFKSPEALKQSNLTSFKSDIWSCGCLLYFFLTSHMPFQSRDVQALKTAIQRGIVNFEGSEWTNINPDMKQLVSKMLSSNPQLRPTASEVINHPIFLNRAKIITKPNKQLSKQMKDFKQQSQMQSAMLNYIAENMLQEQDKKKLMEEFQKFDLNKDGQLTKQELLTVYTTMYSSEQANQEVEAIFSKIDQNGSGRIDYQEFVLATIDQKKYFNREKLLMLFQQIDRDHSGQLSKLEVKKLLRDMQVPKEKLDQLSKQLDQDGDGQIAQEEFLQIMLSIA
ncbi:unnamed protein product [Paramecium pentaurelia]|uniref:Protein kinase domain containing protein n=2 Tax=Paramecium pentaurelia TaxID=43138 RepID=A0A8S1UX43_9CILI|nr:unnamed protein product [Paramecium pentaurelia]